MTAEPRSGDLPQAQADPHAAGLSSSQSVAVQPSDEPYPDPCVGILFVHGAGEHAVGDTLVKFGQPLMSWIAGWLDAGRGASEEELHAIETGQGSFSSGRQTRTLLRMCA